MNEVFCRCQDKRPLWLKSFPNLTGDWVAQRCDVCEKLLAVDEYKQSYACMTDSDVDVELSMQDNTEDNDTGRLF
jgi:predicted helicase